MSRVVFLVLGLLPLARSSLAPLLTSLYPTLPQISNLSYAYTVYRYPNSSRSFASLYCDIVLELGPGDLESCSLSDGLDTYTVDKGGAGRRLVVKKGAEGWGGEEGWTYVKGAGWIEYRSLAGSGASPANLDSPNPGYQLSVKVPVPSALSHLSQCNELFSDCPFNFTKSIITSSTGVGIGCCALLLLWLWIERKSKVLSCSMTPLLASIVLGSAFTFTCLLLRTLANPPSWICYLIPWFKELGFSLTFGGIVLKVYRYLVEFRTRKAHRWIVREKDLLRYLSGILTLTTFYLFSYMSSSPEPNCSSTYWTLVSELGEVSFLLFALHMCWHIRNSSANYNEKIFITICLFMELLGCVGVVVGQILRADVLAWIYYAKEFGINICIVVLVVGSKIIYVFRDKKARNRSNTRVKTTLDLNGDLPEINLDEMEISDIRTELKRVYTQLELLRNKTMRKDNPHISKRRGGRKPTHRRFSLQKKGSREKALRRNQQQRSFRYNVEDIEDSVCSIEGPSTYSEAGR